jgi:hypothetical protein
MKRFAFLIFLLTVLVSCTWAQKVVLSPPPNAHYWGERLSAVGIDSVNQHIGDTIKTTGKIFGYKVINNKAIIYLGAAYPDQKLTVVLTGNAKEFLYAQIHLNINAISGAGYLKNKKLSIIGMVSLNKGEPEIVSNDPNGFIVE